MGHMPRAISGGLWRNVSLIVKNPERFEGCYMYTRRLSLDENYAECAMFYNIKIDGDFARDYEVEVEGECNGHKFYKKDKVWSFSDNCFIYVKDAQFWWPRNAGEPNLYNVTAKLLKNGKELDRKEFTLGIRSVELFYSKCVNEAGEGDFHFEINGKKIFMMGTNWVPMDPFHSRDKQRLPKALEMADDVGCNMMRCWGGNVYEDDDFYDFCDRHGIMIWQDFGMACGVYGVDDRFLGLIYDEAVAVIKRLRQHPCLALWSGDNECDSQNEPFYMAYHREPNENESTRRVIKKALRQHDFTRPYIPSSPYLIDVNMYDYRGENRVVPPEEHTWGPRDYFKSESYTKLLCYFASECGYHGCPSPQTLKKIIRPDQLWPIFEEGGKAKTDWQLHATCCEDEDGVQNTYRLPLMSSHVDTMFGGADNIEDFARRSQCSQAEAFKYFIERFRLEKWRRTGILWWNLVDGWPQISDAVVDYYYSKKLAYHFIKRSQNPVCVMVAEPQDGKYKIFAVNDLPQDKQVTVKITDLKNGKLLCESTFTAPADKSINFAELDEVNDLTMFKIEYSYDGKNYLNHYTTKTRDIKAEEYLDLLDKCGIAEFDF
ncbi:MAG: hypothetical protein KBS41_05595 [Oscillospiraceae bacterium]|nr:hypothetical protein [Candidatus Equicaccousia limihippi]